MDFKAPYLLAMRERAPAMFNELRRSGKLDEHLTAKSKEAHAMFADLTKGMARLPSGYPRDEQAASAAERTVLETLIEFHETSGRGLV